MKRLLFIALLSTISLTLAGNSPFSQEPQPSAGDSQEIATQLIDPQAHDDTDDEQPDEDPKA